VTAAGQEPLRVTLLRNGLIGLVVGLVVARVQRQPASWAAWTAFALWFSFGGHWVELFFLNWVRPRLNSARGAQIAGRMVIWLVGGTVLMVGARITVLFFSPSMRLPPSWLGGPVLVCVELLAHALLQLRGRPNFYNGLR
jgi:hypothetical protein